MTEKIAYQGPFYQMVDAKQREKENLPTFKGFYEKVKGSKYPFVAIRHIPRYVDETHAYAVLFEDEKNEIGDIIANLFGTEGSLHWENERDNFKILNPQPVGHVVFEKEILFETYTKKKFLEDFKEYAK